MRLVSFISSIAGKIYGPKTSITASNRDALSSSLPDLQTPSFPVVAPPSFVGLSVPSDSTSAVNGILGSLRNAYSVTRQSLSSAYDRIMPGASGTFSKLENSGSGWFGFLHSASPGLSNMETFVSLTLGMGAAFLATHVFGTSITTGLIYGKVTFGLSLLTMGRMGSPTERYLLKRSLFPIALTASVFSFVFYLASQFHTDFWVNIPVLWFGLFSGNVLRHYHYLSDRVRRERILNASHQEEIDLMYEYRRFSEFFYRAKWEGWDKNRIVAELQALAPERPENAGLQLSIKGSLIAQVQSDDFSLETVCRQVHEELQRLVYAVPEYTRPDIIKMAIFATSRIWSNLVLIPLATLFLSGGFTSWATLLYMMFWFAQMIYGPSGQNAFYQLEVGTATEPPRYPHLSSDVDKIPDVKIIRLSNQGLYRDGQIPVFLIMDIVNWVFAGYKVQIVLDNDSKQIRYPETMGAVNNANELAARAWLAIQVLAPSLPRLGRCEVATRDFPPDLLAALSNIPAPTLSLFFEYAEEGILVLAGEKFDLISLARQRVQDREQKETIIAVLERASEFSRDQKIIFAKLFLRENLWDPTHEFDHACNTAQQGPQPHSRTNALFHRHGDEAGDYYCGLAIRSLLLRAASSGDPHSSALRRVAEMIVSYSSDETRFSLYNIFDDSWIELCCREIQERLSLSDDERTAVYQLIIDNREGALIQVYYEEASGRGINVSRPRAWVIAANFIQNVRRNIAIAELAPLMDRLISRNATAEERETLVSGISELFDIDIVSADAVVTAVEREDLGLAAAYIVEKPIMPSDYRANLTSLAMLMMAFETRFEDSNLPAWFGAFCTTGPQTPGQAVFYNYLVQLVDRTKPSDLPKAVQDFMNRLLYASDNPSPDARVRLSNYAPTTGITIGRKSQLTLKMVRLLFPKKGVFVHLGFMVRSFLRARATRSVAAMRRYSRVFGESELDYLTSWINGAGTAVASAVGHVQLFPHDYVDQAQKLGLSNGELHSNTVENIIWEKWLAGELDFQQERGLPSVETLVYQAIDEYFATLSPEYRARVPRATLEVLKRIVWDTTKEELECNRNIIRSLVNGFAWIMAHEIPGIEFLAASTLGNLSLSDMPGNLERRREIFSSFARNDNARVVADGVFEILDGFILESLDCFPSLTPEEIQVLRRRIAASSRLPEFIEGHFPQSSVPRDSRVSSSDGLTSRTYQSSLPSTVIDARLERASLIGELRTHLGGRGYGSSHIEAIIASLSKDVETLCVAGIGSFPTTRGHLLAYWDLRRQIPHVLLEGVDLYKYHSSSEDPKVIPGGEGRNFGKVAKLIDFVGKLDFRTPEPILDGSSEFTPRQFKHLFLADIARDVMRDQLVDFLPASGLAIDWLNLVLRTDVYNTFSLRKVNLKLTLEAQRLVSETETFRGVAYNQLPFEQRAMRLRLSRLALESAYPVNCPISSASRRKTLESEKLKYRVIKYLRKNREQIEIEQADVPLWISQRVTDGFNALWEMPSYRGIDSPEVRKIISGLVDIEASLTKIISDFRIVLSGTANRELLEPTRPVERYVAWFIARATVERVMSEGMSSPEEIGAVIRAKGLDAFSAAFIREISMGGSVLWKGLEPFFKPEFTGVLREAHRLSGGSRLMGILKRAI